MQIALYLLFSAVVMQKVFVITLQEFKSDYFELDGADIFFAAFIAMVSGFAWFITVPAWLVFNFLLRPLIAKVKGEDSGAHISDK